MPTDAAFPFHFDESGDIATAEGENFYHRHALQLALIAADQEGGESITPADVRSFQSTVEALIEDSPYFDPPVTTSVNEVTNEQVSLSVDVPNLSDFEITV